MTREESLKLTHALGRLTLPSQRNIDYAEIARTFTNRQVKEDLLHSEQAFTGIMQDFSLGLLDFLNEVELNEGSDRYNQLKNFLEPPGIFDGIVAVLAQELRRSPIRVHLCDKKKGRKILIR